MTIDLKEIKNIIFDLGGVILNIDYDLTAKAFKDMGFTNFDYFYSQQNQTDVFNNLETGKLSNSDFITEIKNQLDTSVADIQIIDAWNAMLLDLPKKRITLLQKLSNDYNIFLLSNTNLIHYISFTKIIEQNHQKDLFNNIFKNVYYSHEIGLRKPDEGCFKYVLDQNNLIASETLFIDDSIQHVEGARAVNINSYHLLEGEDIITLFSDTAL